jgi:hypothetical protein
MQVDDIQNISEKVAKKIKDNVVFDEKIRLIAINYWQEKKRDEDKLLE